MSASEGRGADAVILTVSGQAQLETAFSAVRDGGTILLFGVKPGAFAQVDLWQLWRREINLITSYSATPDLLPRAMAILGGDGYPLEKTISHSVKLSDAAAGFQFVRDGSASKVVITRE
jgi:L-iditol 2-dehydrogenase